VADDGRPDAPRADRHPREEGADDDGLCNEEGEEDGRASRQGRPVRKTERRPERPECRIDSGRKEERVDADAEENREDGTDPRDDPHGPLQAMGSQAEAPPPLVGDDARDDVGDGGRPHVARREEDGGERDARRLE
jgi:hypothetical protein